MKASFNLALASNGSLLERIALANPSVLPVLDANEVVVSAPTVSAGLGNTDVLVTFKPGGRFTGAVTFNYDRIDLATLPVASKVPAVVPFFTFNAAQPTSIEIVTNFQSLYGLTGSADAFSVTNLAAISSAAFTHVATISAAPNDYNLVGSLNIKLAKPIRKALHDSFMTDMSRSTMLYEVKAPGLLPRITFTAPLVNDALLEAVNFRKDAAVVDLELGQDLVITRVSNVLDERARDPEESTRFLITAGEEHRYRGELKFIPWDLNRIPNEAMPSVFYLPPNTPVDSKTALALLTQFIGIPFTLENTILEPVLKTVSPGVYDVVTKLRGDLWFTGNVKYRVNTAGNPNDFILNQNAGSFELTWTP